MRRLLAALVLAVAGLTLFSPATAEAHSALATSDPGAGAVLERAPSVVVLTFTEAPDLSLSTVHVLDQTGKAIERGKPTVVGGQRTTLAVALPGLDRGSYTVAWRATSSEDGHTTTGSFAFGVGVQPVAAATAQGGRDPLPSTLSVVGRWSFYAGLMVLLGAAAMVLLVDAAAVVRYRRPLLLAWCVAAAGAGVLALDLTRTTGVGFSRLVSTTTGGKLLVEVIAVAVAGGATWIAVRRPQPRTFTLLGLAAAVALFARARAGHAAASSVPAFTIATQWVHMLAIGVWLGGLPWLVAALRSQPAEAAPRIARRFSSVAAIALVGVVISGTLRSIDEVGSWSGLFDTKFGVTLLIKLGIVTLVLALAAANRFRHVAEAGRRLRVSATGEVLIGAGVLVASALLAGLTPSASLAAATPQVTPVVVTGSDFATTMRVRLTVSPGTAGLNRFVATVTDYDTSDPVPARTVALRFAAEGRADIPAAIVDLRRAGNTWVATSPVLTVDGRWLVTTVVQSARGGTEVPLVLTTRPPSTRVTAQRTPGLPTIYTITTGSRQVQAYLDPGKVGANEVHFTFVDAAGQPVDSELASITARKSDGDTRTLTFRRLDTGHFVADAELTAGQWRFSATTADGFRTSFRETIP